MMVIFSALVALALVLSTEGSVGPSTNASFCSESKECLEYELICKTEEYEVRHYSPTRWVSTDAEAYFMGVGAAMAFRRLFQYITGANDAGVQMEMTAPVLVKIPEETKLWEPAIYTLSFPLPSAYQDQPPSPTNDKLYFTEMPGMDVYVRSYGGWMLSITSRLHTHLLTKELSRVRASFNHTFHFGVGYDSPLKLVNRHNEVWYVAEGEPVCTDPQEPTPAHTTTPTPTLGDYSPTDALPDSPPHTLSDSPLSSVAPTNLSSAAPTNVSSAVPSNVSSAMPSNLSVMPSNQSSITPANLMSSSVTPFNLSSATPSNLSSSTPSISSSSSSSSSSQSPSDAPSSLSPSHIPPSAPASHLPAEEASFSDLPAALAQVSGDPASNYTDDVSSASPSLEPQAADVDLWNNTVHSSPETQADSQ